MPRPSRHRSTLVILLALLLDLLLGEPPAACHPVVGMGRFLAWGRSLAPGETRRRFLFGGVWTLLGLLLSAGAGAGSARLVRIVSRRQAKRGGRGLGILGEAWLLSTLFSGRGLFRAGEEVTQALERGDLEGARRLLAWHLVSRETSRLSEEEVGQAVLESVAENLTDSLLAPLLAYRLGGLGGAAAYRFVNTGDAMWGYRDQEREWLGKPVARLDDLLNWLPARLMGGVICLAGGLHPGASGWRAWRTMRGQHGRTASPNSGWTMAATAGALGVTLAKPGVYALEGGSAPVDVRRLRQGLGLLRLAAILAVMGVIGAGSRAWRVGLGE